jgi:hypothetical protein
MYSDRATLPGVEIYTRYDTQRMTNFYTLFSYGFTVDEFKIKGEFVKFEYGLNMKDHQFKKKVLHFLQKGIRTSNIYKVFNQYNNEDHELFNIIRVNCVKEDFWDYMNEVSLKATTARDKSTNFHLKHLQHNPNKEIEICFLDKLRKIMNNNYDKFGETFEEDLQFLENHRDSLDYNRRNIYNYRLSIKYIYKYYLNFVIVMKKLYQMEKQEVENYISNNPSVMTDFGFYIKTYIENLI